jgi:hypothetical protein
MTITPAADVWSWALVVLAAFCGERSWSGADDAPSALERSLARGSAPSVGVAMPRGLAEVLRQCLRLQPTERPADMTRIAGHW